MSRPTILFVHSSNPADSIGGGEASLLALAGRLQKDYRPIIAISGVGELHARLEQAGLETRVIPMDPLYITVSRTNPLRLVALVLKTLFATYRIARLIHRESADLVCSNVQGGHIFGGLASKLLGRPMVMYMRDIPQGPVSTRLFRAIAHRLATRVICISNGVREFFASDPRHGKEIAAKAIVVFNGIDVDEVTPRPPSLPVKEELGLADAFPVVTLVGRLQPWKGQRDLIDAAPMVREAFPHARFLFVGETFQFQEGYAAELKSAAAAHGVENAVTFTGQRKDVFDILSLTDIAVSASWHEPFGRVIIEAMAMERPVIGTRAGGIPDIIDDGDTGLMVPPRNPAALAVAIITLAGDRQAAKEMGKRARQQVVERFSIEGTVRGARAVIEGILAGAE